MTQHHAITLPSGRPIRGDHGRAGRLRGIDGRRLVIMALIHESRRRCYTESMASQASPDAVPSVEREDPELRFAIDQAIASARLEGVELRPYVLAAVERLVRGEISTDELVDIVLRGG